MAPSLHSSRVATVLWDAMQEGEGPGSWPRTRGCQGWPRKPTLAMSAGSAQALTSQGTGKNWPPPEEVHQLGLDTASQRMQKKAKVWRPGATQGQHWHCPAGAGRASAGQAEAAPRGPRLSHAGSSQGPLTGPAGAGEPGSSRQQPRLLA